MTDLVAWLRDLCRSFELEPYGLYCRRKDAMEWPITAHSEGELRQILEYGGCLEPLPQESSTLGNILEGALTSFLMEKLENRGDVLIRRGRDRGYPDIELTGTLFGNQYHAVDIKVARRAKSLLRTQSRITLYTGNTYFKYPELQWPSILRPFSDYATHSDLIAIYTLDEQSLERVKDLELIVHESWRIASKDRSSTTREYIGAVQSIERLREGQGEFETPEQFYAYWRKYPFRIPKSVSNQLAKLLQERSN